MTKYHIMLLTSVLLTAVVLVFFKIISMDARGDIIRVITDMRLYFALGVYGLAFMLWIISASKIDYTILVFSNTLGLVISGIVGYFIFNETMNITKIFSYSLIATGVVLLISSSAKN